MGSPYKPLAVVFLVILVAKASVDVSFGSRVYSDDVLCIESEKQALLSFKRDLIDPLDRLSSWTAEDRECCRWAGVVCDNVTGHVKELGLSSSDLGYEDQLKGKINPSLLELKYLTYLDLSYNDFLGTQISSFFGSLVSLRYLNLSGVGLVGKIPHQLGNLSSLIHLDLRGPELLSFGYQLYADSLDWLSTLSSLQYLDMSSRYLGEASDWLLSINKLPSLLELRLSYCQLPHIHPVSHVNLTSLKILDISSNSFVSSSLGWLFSLHNLVSIDLSGNNLGHNDPIPCGLRNMTQLKNLDLSDNDFNSTIPKCLYRFANLEHLLLSSNILQGVMSSAIGNLTSLVGLDLSSNALEGKIPPTMGKLCNLESLSLGGNKLGGKVSNALKSLSGCNPNRLKLLNLVGNSFTGEITDQIGELENLVELNLRSNLLSGPIPMSLRKLSSLEMLYIDDNKLNGTLPEWFGSLSNLKEVDISYNLFWGVVSEVHLANLTNLYYLDASKNSLILRVSPDWVPPFYLRALLLRSLNLGPRFPMWLKSQRNFTVMDLSDTRISGAIPNWFWNLSNRISFLNLSHNQLHGKVPSLNLHRPYSVIYLDSNKFEGPLPRISSNVQELDLSDNSFSGDISHFLCHPIGVGNILDLVHLGRNLLSGNIPDCWMHWPSLQVIKLDDNNLTGEIPRSIGSLQHLESLHLRNNSLSGEIPPSLRNCTTLKVIDLGLNNFVGKIPAWIGLDLSNLMVLSLRANKFGGMIPNEICHLARLQILDAADNYLSGSIPICFKNFISMATKPDSGHVISYSMFANFLEDAVVVTRGREDRYDKILRLVASLDLSNNNLSGELPEELTTLHGLLSLNLSGNHLRGKIPDSISSLRWVQSVDLSRNQLTSKIPPSISDLSFLSQFNVSHNNLSGEIPLGTQLQSLDPSCFMGNQLCGPPLPKRCRADQNTMPTDNEDEKGQKESGDGDDEEYWFRLGIAVGFAVGFLGIISPLVLCRFYRCAYYWFFQEYLWYKILDCYIKFKRMGRQ